MKTKRQVGERVALQAAIADGSIVDFTWEEEDSVQVIISAAKSLVFIRAYSYIRVFEEKYSYFTRIFVIYSYFL